MTEAAGSPTRPISRIGSLLLVWLVAGAAGWGTYLLAWSLVPGRLSRWLAWGVGLLVTLGVGGGGTGLATRGATLTPALRLLLAGAVGWGVASAAGWGFDVRVGGAFSGLLVGTLTQVRWDGRVAWLPILLGLGGGLVGAAGAMFLPGARTLAGGMVFPATTGVLALLATSRVVGLRLSPTEPIVLGYAWGVSWVGAWAITGRVYGLLGLSLEVTLAFALGGFATGWVLRRFRRSGPGAGRAGLIGLAAGVAAAGLGAGIDVVLQWGAMECCDLVRAGGFLEVGQTVGVATFGGLALSRWAQPESG